MIPESRDEAINALLGALRYLKDSGDEPSEVLSYLWTPPKRLDELVDELDANRTAFRDAKGGARKGLARDAGVLMEKIAAVTCSALAGVSEVQSFQSAGPQYDLIVSGVGEHWRSVLDLLYLELGSDLVVEAKAENSKVNDSQFARLANLMDVNLVKTAAIGVFFSIKGATGFPVRGRRQRAVQAARLRQVLFYARTGRPIVVLDLEDIRELRNPGAFPRILRSKVRTLEQLPGVEYDQVTGRIVDVPEHIQTELQQVVSDTDSG